MYTIVIILENGYSNTNINFEAESPKDAVEQLYANSNEIFLIVELVDGQTIFIPKDKVLSIAITKKVVN